MGNNNKRKKIKYAIAFFVLLFLGVALLSVGGGLNIFVAQNQSFWEWNINVGQTDVSFTQTQLDSCFDDAPEDVFRSILPGMSIEYDLVVFYEDPEGNWDSWAYGRPHNTLEEIMADKTYTVTVSQDPGRDLVLRIADRTAGYWKIHLNQGWNNIVYHQNMLDTFYNKDPVTVLNDIDPYWTFMFEHETLKNYWYNQEDPSQNGGTLQHVQNNVLYYVHVSEDCVYEIGTETEDTGTSNWLATMGGVFCLFGAAFSGIRILMIGSKKKQ